MNTLVRWDPFKIQWNPSKERDDLESRLTAILGHRTSTGNGGKEALTVAEWSPLVDIVENEQEYLIKAELPEVKKEDVRLTVEDEVLTISGERKFEKEEKGRKHHRIERAYGSFVRSFSLPEDADGSKVTADYKDGVLHVHLPKSEKAKPKSIEIKVS
ncbi:MAG: Heat shock protein Hsp20 [Nitrospira sp.]|nr:MAG: Heat shock protein Hsp20 [Nitrospira sp.]